jgi:hypothetical protein
LLTTRAAQEYLSAAGLVKRPAGTEVEAFTQRLCFPAYYLVGHAIELALKAFLLGRGMSVSKLRSKTYGHSSALLLKARRRRLGLVLKLKPSEVAAIRTLDECYSAKEFEYVVNGARRVPPYALAYPTASSLCTGLRAYCAGLASNPSIERTSSSKVRLLRATAHVQR